MSRSSRSPRSVADRVFSPACVMLVGVVFLCLLGCTAKPGKTSGSRPTPGRSASSDEPSDSAETPAAPAASADQKAPADQAAALLPILHENGPVGALPDRVVIEFARPIIDKGSDKSRLADEVSAHTVVKIAPKVAGRLSFLGTSTLAFVPTGGFAPATRYTVSLQAVQTRTGVVRPSSPWTYSFTTPRFALLRMTLAHAKLGEGADGEGAEKPGSAGNPGKKKPRRSAELLLTFSGPTEAEWIKRHAAFRLDGAVQTDLTVEAGERPHQVRVTLRSDRLRVGSVIQLSLAAGAPLKDGAAHAAATEAQVTLDEGAAGKAVSILAAHRREGGSGFYIDLICDDETGGERRDYWDPEENAGDSDDDQDGGGKDYPLSRRCLLRDSDAAERIHFSPPVKFTVAPSGGGFRILGDFKRGAYTLRIDAGARSVDGGTLVQPFARSFSVPARSPKISFVSQGRYLPRRSWSNLPISHLNADQVELSVRQVPQENLVFWMSDDQSEAADERNSNLILKRKIRLRGAPDQQTTSWIDVAALLPRTTRGVLELTLSMDGESTTSRILLTDINLVAKSNLGKGRTGADAPAGHHRRHGRFFAGRGGAPKGDAKGDSRNADKDAAKDDLARNEVLVWALDMDSAEPLSGVEVRLVRKSGQVVARCTTLGRAGCPLRLPEMKNDAKNDAKNDDDIATGDIDPSPPFALLASKGDDLTYLKFSELKTEISEEQIQGEPYVSDRPYRAAIYADRGVYRPGDTVHLSAIWRDGQGTAPKAGMPVQAKIVDPRTNVLSKSRLTLNAAGMMVLDVPLSSFAPTGKYQLDLQAGGKPVASYGFLVEEFVPERMKVSARTAAADSLSGAAVDVQLEAHYLFGSVAANHQVELTCELAPAAFAPHENGHLHFGQWRSDDQPQKAMSLGKQTGTLDGQGRGTLSCPGTAEAGKFQGTARLSATAAVFEAGSGRTTQARAGALVHPERYYLGLLSGVEQASPGKAIPVSGAVVDWSGKIIGSVTSLQAELYRLEDEYGWLYDEAEGRGNYQHYVRPILEGQQAVAISGGKFSFSLTPAGESYRYLVRVQAGKAQTDLEVSGSGYRPWWPGESRADQTPRPLRPTALEVRVKDRIRTGEAASLSVKLPYRGQALFTVETDHVLSSEWRAVEAGEVSWPFKVESFAPNVYASVFLVKDPHLDSQQAFMPDRAFGVKSVAMELGDYTQGLKLEVPQEVRSHSKLEVKLEVDMGRGGGHKGSATDGPPGSGGAGGLQGPIFVTVAAVDEGILSLTGFVSPDPLQAIFERRALGVDTFETVGWSMLIPPGGPSRSTGGDADEGVEQKDKAGRVQPVKPVALFSGLLSVPDSGKLTIPFDLPQYRGALRIMAVAAGPTRIGKASAQVIVRDPLVVQATLPRFLTDGDDIQVPVFLSNLSGAAQQATISLSAEDLPVPGLASAPGGPGGKDGKQSPLILTGPQRQILKLKSGESGRVVFRARATQQYGAARLRVTARAGSLESYEEADVPFLPAGPRSRIVQRIPLEQGSLDLLPYLKGWVPTSEQSTFWVTANPYGEAFEHLGFLLHYPYGCIEQTTSATRPLLFAASLIDSMDPRLLGGSGGGGNKKIDDLVMAGVQRVFSMQTPSGGFGFWPGDTKPYLWGTAYAAHMLLDARKLGYAVSSDRLDAALNFLEEELTSKFEAGVKPDADAYHYSGNPEPYMQLVLALAGRGRKGRIQHLIDHLPNKPSGEEREHPYMLKAALYLSGDHRYERDLKNPDTSPVTAERENDWTLYSDRRRRGFMLSTFQDLFGDDPAGEPLAEQVAEALRDHPSFYYTTQELAWGITGLGKRVARRATHFAAPVLLAEGKKIAEQKGQAGKVGKEGRAGDASFALRRASEYQALSLSVPEKGQGTLYLILASEGVLKKPDERKGGAGLKLSRRYLDSDGHELDLRGKLSLGQLIFAEITLSNTSAERISNIALVDRFPAAWEIENPRLGRGSAPDWVNDGEAWEADYMNLRDDRIEVFGSLAAGQSRKLVYVLRAVTAGRFTAPSVEAEAMYDPAIWARQPGARVTVAGPWADDKAGGSPDDKADKAGNEPAAP